MSLKRSIYTTKINGHTYYVGTDFDAARTMWNRINHGIIYGDGGPQKITGSIDVAEFNDGGEQVRAGCAIAVYEDGTIYAGRP